MKKIAIATAAFLLPSLALAQSAPNTGYAVSLLQQIETIIGYVVPILFSLAFIIFIIGVIRYVIAGSAEAKEGAQKVMIYGIIGLAVMASVWGIVKVLQNVFDVGNSSSVTIPALPTYQGN